MKKDTQLIVIDVQNQFLGKDINNKENIENINRILKKASKILMVNNENFNDNIEDIYFEYAENIREHILKTEFKGREDIDEDDYELENAIENFYQKHERLFQNNIPFDTIKKLSEIEKHKIELEDKSYGYIRDSLDIRTELCFYIAKLSLELDKEDILNELDGLSLEEIKEKTKDLENENISILLDIIEQDFNYEAQKMSELLNFNQLTIGETERYLYGEIDDFKYMKQLIDEQVDNFYDRKNKLLNNDCELNRINGR